MDEEVETARLDTFRLVGALVAFGVFVVTGIVAGFCVSVTAGLGAISVVSLIVAWLLGSE